MNTFSKSKSQPHYSNVISKLKFVWSSGSLLILASLLLPSTANAEGSAQININGNNQNLFEYPEPGAAETNILDIVRPLYVDILSAGEVINISLCGYDDSDPLRVEIYDSFGTQVLARDLTEANVTCTSDLNFDTGDENPIKNPIQYVTTSKDRHEIRLYNQRTTGENNLNEKEVFKRFDITVTDEKDDPVDPRVAQGRLHAYSWAFNAGGFSANEAADTNYYTLVPGGRSGQNFVWMLDLNNFAGFSYEILANNIGVEPPNSGLSTPVADNSIEPLYPIYLGYPAVAGNRPTVPPEIANFTFTDDAGVDYSISPGVTTGVQDSGTFQFRTDVDGTYAITIDTNKNGNFGADDTLLLGVATDGDNSVVWDGRDSEDNILPEGSYDAQLAVRLGEYHFVAGDAETSGGGTDNGLTIYEALSSGTQNTQVFWDDKTLLDGSTTLPDGATSGTPESKHTWGDFDGSSFGNTRYIDTYVYGDFTIASTPVAIDTADEPPDYGDAPDSYGDASHITYATPNVYLGSVVPDGETDTQLGTDAGASAAGDDNDGNDDEDAFANLPNVPSIGNYRLNVPVTTDGNATLHGWVDFDKDGKFEEGEGEYQTAPVTSSGDIPLSWSVPAGTTPGSSYVRLRLTSDTLTDDDSTSDIDERSVGSASDGEVEDYPVTIELTTIYDYGDAPDENPGTNPGDYQTTSSDNGAAQIVINDPTSGKLLSIGSNVDADSGDLQDANALADDEDGAPDDEDGVESFPVLSTTAGQEYTVSVTARNNITEEVAGIEQGVPAYLVGFIDFNKDGNFFQEDGVTPDPGERSNLVEISSDNSDLRTFPVEFTTPTGMTPGITYARFVLGQAQLTAQQAAGVNPGTDNGEVEDYRIAIAASVSGTLYEDSDTSDTFDAGEPRLPENINVSLLSSDGTAIIDTTVTDANGDYIFNGVASGDYQILVDSNDPDIFQGLIAGTSTSQSISIDNSDVTEINFGFDQIVPSSDSMFCRNPYGEVYSGGVSNDIYALHPETGASERLTNNALSGVVNSLATDHFNRIVYYADGQAIYAWNPLSDTHTRLGDSNGNQDVDQMPGGANISTLTSGGAAFYNGSLYLGIEQRAGNSQTEVYRVNFVPGSNGQVVQSLTPLGVNDSTGGADGALNNADWGDMIFDDNGILYGATRAAGLTWSFDLSTGEYNQISSNYLGQLAKDGEGRIWGLADNGNIQQVNTSNGTLIGPSQPTNLTIADLAECVSGRSAIGDRVWSDTDLDGVQDPGEPGIADVTVGIYRDLNNNGAIDNNDPLLATQATNANGNYDFTDLIFGDYIIVVLEGTANDLDATNVLENSTLTSASDTLAVNLATGIVDYNDADFGYEPSASNPNLLLVKRITAINPDQSDEIRFTNFVNDDGNDDGDPNNDPDNDPNWPENDDTYLSGAISVDNIQPGDEVEYTIYFLSNGDAEATNIQICDVIPNNMSFVANAYDAEVGMALGLNATTLPTEPNTTFTNAADTDDGTFYAPGTAPPTVTTGDPPTTTNLCQKVDSAGNTVSVGATENINGAIVVEIDSLPDATGAGTPTNSYGFIRFRAEVQ